jgi:hypothetical protein
VAVSNAAAKQARGRDALVPLDRRTHDLDERQRDLRVPLLRTFQYEIVERLAAAEQQGGVSNGTAEAEAVARGLHLRVLAVVGVFT